MKNNQFASWDALCSALPPFAAVVISPGPGSPANAADFGVCSEAYDAGLPLFGVCLGHQGLALSVGATVGLASEPMHGRLSDVTHAGCELFAGLPRSFRAVRYHSLVVEAASVPSCLEVTAWTASGEVMALRHRSLPQYGVQVHCSTRPAPAPALLPPCRPAPAPTRAALPPPRPPPPHHVPPPASRPQFHPESICTEYGEALVANFARLAARSAARRAPMASPRLTPPLSPASLSPDSLSPSRAGTPDASDAPPVPRRLGAPPPAARRLLVSEVGGGRFLDSAAVFEALFGASPVAYWLDSSCCSSSGDTPTGEPARARYSYMGAFGGPHSSLLRCGAGGGISLVGRDGADESLSGGSLLQAMRERLVPWEGAESVRWDAACGAPVEGPEGRGGAAQELPPFRGGWVGFFSYEAWRRVGPEGAAAARDCEPSCSAATPEAPRSLCTPSPPLACPPPPGHAAAPHPPRRRRSGSSRTATSPSTTPHGAWSQSASATPAERGASRARSSGCGRRPLRCSSEACPRATRREAERRRDRRRGGRRRRVNRCTGGRRLASRARVAAMSTRRTSSASSSCCARVRAGRVCEGAQGWAPPTRQPCPPLGESYEVCLTTQFRAPPPRAAPPPSPLALHLALRRVNPAPYAAFLHFDLPALRPAPPAGGGEREAAAGGAFSVCCSSPERFLRIGADGSVESKPIKGSRRDARACPARRRAQSSSPCVSRDDASRADGRARRRQCRDPAHFAEGAFAHTRARLVSRRRCSIPRPSLPFRTAPRT